MSSSIMSFVYFFTIQMELSHIMDLPLQRYSIFTPKPDPLDWAQVQLLQWEAELFDHGSQNHRSNILILKSNFITYINVHFNLL